MRKALTGIVLALAATGAAQAEPMTSDAAKKQLFSPSKMILHITDQSAFGAGMRQAVNLTLDQMKAPSQMAKFLEAGYGYYGAVAFPLSGDGQVPPTIIAQLNTPEAAQRAAIEACQQANGGQCVVAALMLPRGYKSRDLTLSQAATARVTESWDDGVAPKFLAYSPTSSAWGIAKGPTASARTAIESCKEADCIVAIADQ
ncbi:hypothetical protein [Maritimibacter sp. UBA3975]|uniref:hypothetical protein n=1 Tax=Maritimibacter sp. UBA3975 TaxID=1946833 RepID=UPI000C09617D|nr:hypothetical protein [Maritimibacter sp. UBA3975]MAM60136.1 hypothetical protein [Maritimibacter sp.]|tara:strand:+ start:46295 stop:46897 length:603 start_codon:yes stop_codon:yes gene_type:complete